MFAGNPPARKTAESISARKTSEVSVLPDHINFFPAPGFDPFSTSIARAIPASVICSARRIIFSSSSVFASRSGQKSPFVVRSLMLDASNSCANPSGKFAGTTADRTPRFRRKCDSTFS